MKDKPVCLAWDIETSLMYVSVYGLKNDGWLSHKSIVKDWHIISGAWKEIGVKTIHSVNLTQDLERFQKDPSDDYFVVKKIRDALVGVDVLIHHNGNRFDLRKLNTRIVKHRLDSLPPIRAVDTLVEAKKLGAFSSNSLDYLARFFGVEHKSHPRDGSWDREMNLGSKEDILDIAKYNRQDVLVLDKVHEVMRPYIKNYPNLFYSDDKCKVCNSSRLAKRGIRRMTSHLNYTFQCSDCGRWSHKKVPFS